MRHVKKHENHGHAEEGEGGSENKSQSQVYLHAVISKKEL